MWHRKKRVFNFFLARFALGMIAGAHLWRLTFSFIRFQSHVVVDLPRPRSSFSKVWLGFCLSGAAQPQFSSFENSSIQRRNVAPLPIHVCATTRANSVSPPRSSSRIRCLSTHYLADGRHEGRVITPSERRTRDISAHGTSFIRADVLMEGSRCVYLTSVPGPRDGRGGSLRAMIARVGGPLLFTCRFGKSSVVW